MHKLLVFILFLSITSSTFAEDGLVTLKSIHEVSQTIDRLEKIISEKGLTIFTRIDHAAGAKKVDIELKPTELLVFGNPKIGTPLMNCNRTAAIDLPQKALAWEDETGQVWLTYNNPNYLSNRHSLTECAELIEKIKQALSMFAKFATQE